MDEREQRVLDGGERRDRERVRGQCTQEHAADVVEGMEPAGDHLHVERRVVVAEHEELEHEHGGGEQRKRCTGEACPREHREREHESDGRGDVDENPRLAQPAVQPAERDVEERELASHERCRERRSPVARERCAQGDLDGWFSGEGRLQAAPRIPCSRCYHRR